MKISRDNQHQRGSQYVEKSGHGQITVLLDRPFQTKLDKRRTAKFTRTAESMLRDVIELKQVALWHVCKIRIDQACEAAAEGMARQPKAPRIISIRRDQIFIRHSSRAHNITADFASTILRIIVVRSGIASNEWWNVPRTEFQRMQAIRACVAATVRRDLKEPVAPVERFHEERVTFRWRRYLLLTYHLLQNNYSYSPFVYELI